MPQTSNISWFNSVIFIFMVFLILFISLSYYNYQGIKTNVKVFKSKFFFSYFF